MSTSSPLGPPPGTLPIARQLPGNQPPLDPAALLSHLWQQSLPLIRTRVHRLEQLAQQAAHDGALSLPARTEAADIAHKLAGSLGMFGYPKGTEIAREMEHGLEGDAVLDTAHFQRLSTELRSHLSL